MRRMKRLMTRTTMSRHAARSAGRRALLCAALMASVGASCGLADLRPQSLRALEQPSPGQVEQGRQALKRMEQAHGTKAAWMALQTSEHVLIDDWPGLVERNTFMPWSQNPTTLRLTMRHGQDEGRLEFLSGAEQGQSWGIQQWATYVVERDGLPTFKAHEDAWFYIPTMIYFIEAPMRLGEAEHVAHLGQHMRQGRAYERVFLTWRSAKPRGDVDQYIAWIDAQTGLLSALEFTARDVAGFAQGAALYEGWHEVRGVQTPRVITITSGVDSPTDVTHRLSVKTSRFGLALPERFLRPDPERRAVKADHGASSARR